MRVRTRQPHPRPCRTARLGLEALESRTVLSAFGGLDVPTVLIGQEPDDIALAATALGDISPARRLAALGTIGPGGLDVDWYQFTLSRPGAVHLTALAQPHGSPLDSLLTLYAGDPADSQGFRRLAQADDQASSTDARISIALAPGTYWVAVSGYGNAFFHPGIASSGTPGSTGDYALVLDAEALADSALHIIRTDPAPGAARPSSPLTLTAVVNRAVDAATVHSGTVRLLHSTDATFDAGDQAVALATVTYDAAAYELRVQLAAPLGPGYYQLTFFGDTTAHPGAVLLDLEGKPLGWSDATPWGRDHVLTFAVTAVEGTHPDQANDTLATAHELGSLAPGGLLQVAGIVGDDPTDPVPFNPNDVDLYRFTITGPGRYQLTAEILAQRLGSPLNSSVTLFDAQGNWIRSNNDSRNQSRDVNGDRPLLLDPLLFAGLTEGTYYLAVTGQFNNPNSFFGSFDPFVSHSGTASPLDTPVGPYVLRLGLTPDDTPPEVVVVTPISDGAVLGGPPTELVITFSEPVNWASLADNVAVVTPDGFPAADLRLVRYDEAASTVRFLFLNGLPNGDYELRLRDIFDYADNRLRGNDPGGDYIVRFTVNGPVRDPFWWPEEEPNDSTEAPQVLGPLFPYELSAGVSIVGQLGNDPDFGWTDGADVFRFEVLAGGRHAFLLFPTGAFLPDGVTVEVTGGASLFVTTVDSFAAGETHLTPGVYTVRVAYDLWDGSVPEFLDYQLMIVLTEPDENPQPLLLLPNPAVQANLPKSLPLFPSAVAGIVRSVSAGVTEHAALATLPEYGPAGPAGPAPVVTTAPIGRDARPGDALALFVTLGNPVGRAPASQPVAPPTAQPLHLARFERVAVGADGPAELVVGDDRPAAPDPGAAAPAAASSESVGTQIPVQSGTIVSLPPASSGSMMLTALSGRAWADAAQTLFQALYEGLRGILETIGDTPFVPAGDSGSGDVSRPALEVSDFIPEAAVLAASAADPADSWKLWAALALSAGGLGGVGFGLARLLSHRAAHAGPRPLAWRPTDGGGEL